MAERRSEQAERALVPLKLLHYLAGRVERRSTLWWWEWKNSGSSAGEPGSCRVAGACQGTGGNEYFDFDRDELTLTGRRTGRSFRLGDPVQVKIVAVDLDERSIRFEMDRRSGLTRRSDGGSRRRKTSGSRSAKRPDAGPRKRSRGAKKRRGGRGGKKGRRGGQR
ncbi:MAG: hypothetical protein CM1200mP2_34620 [Planctomycetaceae bacterium]|nr:MAG: hypothetical protein CM1200mP2_34620 [Planctomycetaceae bacterium]